MPEDWIQMGTLARAHGIRGELSVDWHADSPLLADMPLWLRDGGGHVRKVRLCSVRRHKGRPLVLLEGVDDRTAAEALRGCVLLVRRDVLPAVREGEAYVRDLQGCRAVLPDGTVLGVIDHFEYPAGREIWVILTDDGREVLFPARPEFIVAFDLAASAVHIAPPEGLLDIYLS